MGKIYLKGIFKEKEFDNGGSIINLNFNPQDLLEYVNEKGYINLSVSKRREVGQYGDTHSVTIYQPNGEKKTNTAQKNEFGDDDISIENIPF